MRSAVATKIDVVFDRSGFMSCELMGSSDGVGCVVVMLVSLYTAVDKVEPLTFHGGSYEDWRNAEHYLDPSVSGIPLKT